MPRPTLSKSIRCSAAASIVACTSTLAANPTQAEVVWSPGPASLIGTYERTSGANSGDPSLHIQFPIDFDQNGKSDFYFFYYLAFRITASRGGYVDFLGSPDLNTNADVVFSSAAPWSPSDPRWDFTPANAASLEEVYDNALVFIPIPDDTTTSNDYLFGDGLNSIFSTRGYWSGVFQDDNGATYVGYLDMEFSAANGLTEDAITIYGSGYALIPEPSSLALLGIGGLLVARRRRS